MEDTEKLGRIFGTSNAEDKMHTNSLGRDPCKVSTVTDLFWYNQI